jgi:hypothetical protein
MLNIEQYKKYVQKLNLENSITYEIFLLVVSQRLKDCLNPSLGYKNLPTDENAVRDYVLEFVDLYSKEDNKKIGYNLKRVISAIRAKKIVKLLDERTVSVEVIVKIHRKAIKSLKFECLTY